MRTKLLLVCQAVCALFIASAEEEKIGDFVWSYRVGDDQWNYSENNVQAAVTGVSPAEGEIVIPKTLGGLPVTRIETCAFSGCNGLMSVTIQDGVKSIGNTVFYLCENLVSVTMPSSVTSIGDYVFAWCENLESFEIPPNLTAIGDNAFQGCSKIKTLTVPSMVTRIGSYAFGSCYGLTSLTLPCGLKFIGEGAFQDCKGLKSLQIPSGVEEICCGAFEWCSSLETLELPRGLTSISDRMFYACLGMKSLTIPSKVTIIGESAFQGCENLERLIISSAVQNIGGSAFLGCVGLKQLSFKGLPPDGISSASVPAATKVTYEVCCAEEWASVWPEHPNKELSVPVELVKVLCRELSSNVNICVSNVVVNYVLNSVKPEFAIPARQDSGFVNIITEVKGGCVAVPETWAAGIEGFTDKFGTDFTKALAAKTGKRDGSGNEMCVWQDYVAGTDPTKVDDVFSASITIVGGKIKISYTPELDETRKGMRKYTTWGKKSIVGNEKWVVVEDGDEASFNFFKVTVEMRNPAQEVESWRLENPDQDADEELYGPKVGAAR